MSEGTARARQVVYGAIAETHGNLPVNSNTKLSDLGYDKLALAALAARIRDRGVNVDTAAVQGCKTVGEAISVVTAAIG